MKENGGFNGISFEIATGLIESKEFENFEFGMSLFISILIVSNLTNHLV